MSKGEPDWLTQQAHSRRITEGRRASTEGGGRGTAGRHLRSSSRSLFCESRCSFSSSSLSCSALSTACQRMKSLCRSQITPPHARAHTHTDLFLIFAVGINVGEGSRACGQLRRFAILAFAAKVALKPQPPPVSSAPGNRLRNRASFASRKGRVAQEGQRREGGCGERQPRAQTSKTRFHRSSGFVATSVIDLSTDGNPMSCHQHARSMSASAQRGGAGKWRACPRQRQQLHPHARTANARYTSAWILQRHVCRSTARPTTAGDAYPERVSSSGHEQWLEVIGFR